METFHRKKVIILRYLKEKGIYLPVGRDDDSLKGQALIDILPSHHVGNDQN